MCFVTNTRASNVAKAMSMGCVGSIITHTTIVLTTATNFDYAKTIFKIASGISLFTTPFVYWRASRLVLRLAAKPEGLSKPNSIALHLGIRVPFETGALVCCLGLLYHGFWPTTWDFALNERIYCTPHALQLPLMGTTPVFPQARLRRVLNEKASMGDPNPNPNHGSPREGKNSPNAVLGDIKWIKMVGFHAFTFAAIPFIGGVFALLPSNTLMGVLAARRGLGCKAVIVPW